MRFDVEALYNIEIERTRNGRWCQGGNEETTRAEEEKEEEEESGNKMRRFYLLEKNRCDEFGKRGDREIELGVG